MEENNMTGKLRPFLGAGFTVCGPVLTSQVILTTGPFFETSSEENLY
jgi:hypothetical protein